MHKLTNNELCSKTKNYKSDLACWVYRSS